MGIQLTHTINEEINCMDATLIMCEAIGNTTTDGQAGQPSPLDPERFKAFVKSPSDIEEGTLRDIAAVIDGRRDVTPDSFDSIPVAEPSTLDRLLNSITIVYITDKDFPIAAATLVDPSKEDYRGIVPIRYYSLLSGYNLDGRVQQEFFAVADEYRNSGISQELRAQIHDLDTPTFIVVNGNDKESMEGLARGGYQFITWINDDTVRTPVQLWIDGMHNAPTNIDDTVQLDNLSNLS